MEKLEVAFFGVCTLLVLLGGVFTVAARNPIRGAMGLLTTILGMAGMYLLLAAELLAAIQVAVYAGAVVVLFLFVIMLIGPSSTGATDARGAVGRYLGAVAFLLCAGLAIAAITRFGGGAELTKMPEAPAGMGTVEVIGRELFTTKVVAFQIAGILLLIAVVGAMAVARGRGANLLLAPEDGAASKSAAKPKELVMGMGGLHGETSSEVKAAPAKAEARAREGASS